ncbi:recombinase family protein [Methylobacterium brachiatum]|uniref:recombinase family protein n=1 Tax=Methylobacterium brachiatum TaxID=269660 RepID=UPI00244BCC74|nr:recombinase family protein [Methylobacterium brachiatum]MDH2312336.1 recombinase family protein [Methylobacterium brachiatum]
MSNDVRNRSAESVADLLPATWTDMHAQAPISSIAGNRCVYYARYSTEDQKESSIERQIEGCESYALSYGMTPLQGGHQFIDRGKSGFYLEGRDDLAALRLLATHGGKGFDKLVCEHLDRLSRNVVHVLQIYHELKALGIEIHVTSGGVGRVDDVHAVLYGFIGMEQRERMLRLMSQGAWRAALRGRHLGGIPYGYRRGQEVGDLVVEENEAAVVKRIYHLFDSGVSATQIARLLNGENLPPPSGSGQWTRSVILGGPSHGKGILRNPKYVGVYIYGKSRRVRRPGSSSKMVQMRPSTSWVYGAKPAWSFVDRNLWLRVLCRLKQMHDDKGLQKPREKLSGKATLLFHGRYRCVCGATMHGRFRGASTTRSLSCYSQAEGGTCERSRSFSSTFVECEILRVIRDTVLTSAHLPAYIREYTAQLGRIEEEVAREKRERLNRIAELDRWLEKSIDSAINKGGADEDLERARIRKRAERSDERLALAALPDIASMPPVDPEAFVSLRDEMDGLIRRMPIAATSEADLLLVQTLRGLVEKVVIDQIDEERGYALEITFTPSALVARNHRLPLAGLDPVTIRRVCPPSRTTIANLAEIDALLRAKADRREYALSDQDWEIVREQAQAWPFDDVRWAMDATLFYLRSGRGLRSLPPPFSGPKVRQRVRSFVQRGFWRLAYEALVEAASPTVHTLDTSRLATMERVALSRRSAAL